MKCHLQFQRWDPVRERAIGIPLPEPVVVDRIEAVPAVGERVDAGWFGAAPGDGVWRVRSRVFALVSEPHFADWRFDVMLVVEQREVDHAPRGHDPDGLHDGGACVSLDG